MTFPDEIDPNAVNRYIEFSTARRGQIAAKDDKNALKLFKWLRHLSQREPLKGFIEMPSDISEISGGSQMSLGGQKYLLPFDTKLIRYRRYPVPSNFQELLKTFTIEILSEDPLPKSE